jgi:Kef-type K+ transport system membrane component KefB
VNTDICTLVIAFIIIALPYGIWRFAGLKSVLPWTVVQILFGITLGPSILGTMAPQLHAALLPASVQDQIRGMAALAVLLFAFVTGLHIDFSQNRGCGKRFAYIGIGSVAVPFAMGLVAVWWISRAYPEFVRSVDSTWLILSLAILLSVTALPALSAVLRELGLLDEPVGQRSLGLAALNDATLWVAMSILLAYAPLGLANQQPLLTISGGILYAAAMFGFVRPTLAGRNEKRSDEQVGEAIFIGVLALAIVPALLNQVVGVHLLLGAFIAGAVVPMSVRAAMVDRIEPAMVFPLTPFFFMAGGLKVFTDDSSAAFNQICLATTLAAMMGKLLGTVVPAPLIGFPWRKCMALRSLMQTKETTELAELSILYDAGLISGQILSALKSMALITTALAMPLAKLFLPPYAGRSLVDEELQPTSSGESQLGVNLHGMMSRKSGDCRPIGFFSRRRNHPKFCRDCDA